MNVSKGSHETTSPSAPRKRKTLKRVLLAAVCIVLVLVALIFFAPGILSGDWGKGKITRIINENIDGSISIDELSLSWFGSQQVDGFKLIDPAGLTVVGVQSVTVDASLWSLLWGGRALGEIKIAHPRVNIVADESGKTNLQKAVGTPDEDDQDDKPSDDMLMLPVTMKLTVTDASITARKPGLEPVRFESGQLSVDMSKFGQPLTFHLEAVTAQGELTGRINVDGSVIGIEADGSIDVAKLRVEAQAEVTDLPVDGIDTLAQLNGVLTAAIGPTLNLQLSTTPDEWSRPTIKLTTTSQHMNVQLDAMIDNEQIVGSGKMQLTLTPALAAKLSDGKAKLAADVPVEVTLESLRAPLVKFDPTKVVIKLDARVADGRVDDLQTFGTMSWSQTYAALDTANLAQSITLDANSQLTHENQPGHVTAQAKITGLFGADGQPKLDQAVIDGHISVADLPTGLLDRLIGGDGLIPLALGPMLAVEIRANSQAGQPKTITISAQTQTLSTDGVELLLTDTAITARRPATVTFQPSVQLLQRYLPQEPDAPVVTNSPTFTATLQQLELPLTEGKPDSTKATLDLAATMTQLDITGISKIGGLSIHDGQLRMKTDAPGDIRTTAQATIFPTTPGIFAEATQQNPVELRAEALICHVEMQHQLDTVHLSMTGGLLQFEADAKTDDQRVLTLAQPATLRMRLTPDMLEQLRSDTAEPPKFTLAAPADILLKIDELNAPTTESEPAATKLHASLEVSELQLAGDPRFAGTTMNDFAAEATFDGPANHFELNATADTKLPNQSKAGSMRIDVDLSNILAEGKVDAIHATGNATAKLVDLPTAFVDALAGQNGLLVTALGDSVNVELRYTAESDGSRGVDFSADSELLKAQGAVDVSENQPIRIIRPLEADWTLTPAAYAKLTAKESAPATTVLTEPAVMHVQIDKLTAPPLASKSDTAPANFDPSKYSVVAKLSLGALKLRHEQSGALASAQNLTAEISGDTLTAITAKANGSLSYVDPAAPNSPATGKLDANAKLSDAFDATGKFALTNATIDAQLNVSDVPVAFVDAIQQLEGMAVAALGDRLNLTMSTQMRQGVGPITVSVRSTHAQADVTGTIREGQLTLAKPLTAQVEITEQLGRLILAKINPIFETAHTADQPIRLTIPVEGVSIPVQDFNIADVRIPQLRIELGQTNPQTGKYDLGEVKLTNGGVLSGLINFAQRFGALPGKSSQEMTVVFTPIILSIEDGRVDYLRRLDLLMDGSFHMASWGYVQFDTTPDDNVDNSNLRVALGIPPDTLAAVFRVEGVPEGDMFVIPIKGPTSKPKVDWGAAVADMGTLQAQYNLIKDSSTGALVRGLVQKVLKSEDARAAPPPSIDPLPWTLPPKPQQAQQPQQQPSPQQQEPQEEKTLEEQLIEEGLRQIFKKK